VQRDQLIESIAHPGVAEVDDPSWPPMAIFLSEPKHVVVRGLAQEDGHWRPTGIIDFGDAWVGDRFYELVALHFSLFQADKRLLQAFLSAYGFDTALRERFAERAMVASLLFEFNSLGEFVADHPELMQTATLDELAARLWAVA